MGRERSSVVVGSNANTTLAPSFEETRKNASFGERRFRESGGRPAYQRVPSKLAKDFVGLLKRVGSSRCVVERVGSSRCLVANATKPVVSSLKRTISTKTDLQSDDESLDAVGKKNVQFDDDNLRTYKNEWYFVGSGRTQEPDSSDRDPAADPRSLDKKLLWWGKAELSDSNDDELADILSGGPATEYKKALKTSFEAASKLDTKPNEALSASLVESSFLDLPACCYEARGLESELYHQSRTLAKKYRKQVLQVKQPCAHEQSQESFFQEDFKRLRLLSEKYSKPSQLVAAQLAEWDHLQATGRISMGRSDSDRWSSKKAAAATKAPPAPIRMRSIRSISVPKLKVEI